MQRLLCGGVHWLRGDDMDREVRPGRVQELRVSGPGAGVGVALAGLGPVRPVVGWVIMGGGHTLAGDDVKFVRRISRISCVPDGSR